MAQAHSPIFLNRQVFVKAVPPLISSPSGIDTSLTNSAQLQLRNNGVAVDVGTVVGGIRVAVGVLVDKGIGV